jgi:prepilin-type N-terminal cleavage/methylation domain-containing protein
MHSNRGFSLIESLIATAVLVPGLVGVALIFPYTIKSNLSSKQTSAATLVITDKMESMRVLPLNHAALTVGGGLNPATPVTGYHDYVMVAANGTMTTSATMPTGAANGTNGYLRLWQVSGSNPKTITIVVQTLNSAGSKRRIEMIRSSTIVTDTF